MSQRWSVTRDDDRAEMLALCIALDLHPDASYERPAERRGVRTPDCSCTYRATATSRWR